MLLLLAIDDVAALTLEAAALLDSAVREERDEEDGDGAEDAEDEDHTGVLVGPVVLAALDEEAGVVDGALDEGVVDGRHCGGVCLGDVGIRVEIVREESEK